MPEQVWVRQPALSAQVLGGNRSAVDFPMPPSPLRTTDVRRRRGDRNNVLNLEAFKAASRGSLDERAFRDAALRAGLAPDEVDATLASAKAAGGASTPTFPRRDKDALEHGLSLMGVALCYNVRRHAAEIKNGGGAGCERLKASAPSAPRSPPHSGELWADPGRNFFPCHVKHLRSVAWAHDTPSVGS